MKMIEKLILQSRFPQGISGKLLTLSFNHSDQHLTTYLIKNMSKKQATVLDVGCGGGKTIKKIKDKHPTYQAISLDHSTTAIQKARKVNKKNNASFICGCIEELPFDNKTFDYISVIRSHYFWKDIKLSFQEIFRTLKTGGCLYILAENNKITYHMSDYTSLSALQQLLETIGYTNIQMRTHHGYVYVQAFA